MRPPKQAKPADTSQTSHLETPPPNCKTSWSSPNKFVDQQPTFTYTGVLLVRELRHGVYTVSVAAVRGSGTSKTRSWNTGKNHHKTQVRSSVEFRAGFCRFSSTCKSQAAKTRPGFLLVFGGSVHMRPYCHIRQNRQKPANLTTCEQGIKLACRLQAMLR
jgi:hypothetical protein